LVLVSDVAAICVCVRAIVLGSSGWLAWLGLLLSGGLGATFVISPPCIGWRELLVNGPVAIGFVALAVWLTRMYVRKKAKLPPSCE